MINEGGQILRSLQVAPFLPQWGALRPPEVPDLSRSHAAAVTELLVAKGLPGMSAHGWEGGTRHVMKGGVSGEQARRQDRSYVCIKTYATSANHTINTAVRVLRLLCAVQRVRCWGSCPGLQRRDRRRSGCRESRCGRRTATQSDSSWCRGPQPRCGRRKCTQTGSPRAEQRGYRRLQTRCGSTSTLTRWRWCSWVSTLHPDCVCHRVLQWHPQTPPNRKFKRSFH